MASKVYYHLGEYDESMLFALGSGDLFDITAKDEYVETIICELFGARNGGSLTDSGHL